MRKTHLMSLILLLLAALILNEPATLTSTMVALCIIFMAGMFAAPKQPFKGQYEDFEKQCSEVIEKIMPKDKVVDFGQIYFKYDNCFWQVEVWQLKSFSSEPAACIFKFPVRLLNKKSLEKYMKESP